MRGATEATFDAKAALGQETTPEKDGNRLARSLFDSRLELDGLVIDMTGVAPEELVSTFVNSFILGLHSHGVDLQLATKIKWRTRFPGEADRIRQLVRYCVEELSKQPVKR